MFILYVIWWRKMEEIQIIFNFMMDDTQIEIKDTQIMMGEKKKWILEKKTLVLTCDNWAGGMIV